MQYLVIVRYRSGNTVVMGYNVKEQAELYSRYMEKEKNVKWVETVIKCDDSSWYNW